MKPLVIINPNAQGGRTGRLADELVRIISRYLGPIDSVRTNRARHGVEIADQAARDGRDAVIVVGGDGTVHEVANGLMRAREDGVTPPKLGVIGQGTGGDFRKTLGIDHRLDHYCNAIASRRTRTIDMGKFRYRDKAGAEAQAYFINILSVGMGGLVDEYVAELSGKMSGTLAYFAASARALVKSEVGILDCVVHQGGQRQDVEISCRNLAICNGRYFGGGMEVAPMAKLDDGLFDVISLGAAPRLKFALSSLSIYSGSHIDHDDVEVLSCDRIDIELRNDSIRDQFPLDVDGEPLGTLPLQIELVPGALEVFVGHG
jgi:diacylglycerol kinase (ATP)